MAPIDAPRILVASAQAQEVKLITMSLRAFYADCRVEAVYSAEELQRCVSEQAWDIILLDAQLLGASGLDLLQALRRQRPQSAIVVVAGRHDPSERTQALQMGADYYLSKQAPAFQTELPIVVQQVLETRELRQRMDSAERYLHLIETMAEVLYELDSEGRFQRVSQTVDTLLGYDPQELVGRHYSTLLRPEDQEQAMYRFNERRIGARATRRFGLQLLPKSDPAVPRRETDVELSAMGLYDQARRFLGTIGIVRNLNGHKQEQERLRQLEALNTTLTSILSEAERWLKQGRDLLQEYERQGQTQPAAETQPVVEARSPALKTTGASIQDCLSNPLDAQALEMRGMTGILGETSSTSAKGPSLWNVALQILGIEARYHRFDVEPEKLETFFDAARRDDRLKGFNVAAPYKKRVVALLDELDPLARRIGSVNTVVRTREGRLIGSNTEGSGAVAGLTTGFPDEDGPFLDQLNGLDVLLIGAGCAGHALAWSLSEAIGRGRLYLANRSRGPVERLCSDLQASYPSVTWVHETAIETVAPRVHLIINVTLKGQTGFFTQADGLRVSLEPYSSLAPANPVGLPADIVNGATRFYEQWYRASLSDILANIERSLRILAAATPSVRIVDSIYSPSESVLLRQARLSGHRAVNGKGLAICQAADAFFHRVFHDDLEQAGRLTPETYRTIVASMGAAW
ncbi:MAG: response regulator [Nitrospirae bacterium]|nr:MAG: response regulator [Nitrospirota bacterium]